MITIVATFILNRQEAIMLRKKGLDSWAAVLAAIFVFVLTGVLLAENGPKIKFDSESHNFGKVEQGKVLNHVFKYSNEGDATLVINNVRTTCGCTAALVSGKKLNPGKNGVIKVSFDTTGYGGNTSKYIYVETNDTETPLKQLTISASIDVPPAPQLELDSYTIDVGLVLESEGIEWTTKITNSGELELTVEMSNTSGDAEFFQGSGKATFPLRLAAGKSTELTIKIPPRQKTGSLREYIMVKSNDQRRPSLSLYMTGYAISVSKLKELFQKYEDIIK